MSLQLYALVAQFALLSLLSETVDCHVVVASVLHDQNVAI